jgi:aconitate hydratase
MLLGIQAVIAESYERIHRSNLIGMGVLPLEFQAGENPVTLGLSGSEVYDILDLHEDLQANQVLNVRATRNGGESTTFKVITRIETPIEIEYYRNGGILHTVLRGILQESV